MNTIRNILVVAWKEIQIIVKDRGSLAILFVLPLVLTSLYGGMNQQFAGGEKEASILIDVCLVNEDPGIYGSQVAGALDEISVLRIEKLATVSEAEQRVAQGHATAAIVLPATLTGRIEAYEPVTLQVIVDPAEPEAASIVTGIMNQVVDELRIWGEVQHGVRTVLQESGVLEGAGPEVQRATEAQSLGIIMTTLGEMRRNPGVAVVSETLRGAEVAGGIELYFALLFPGITVMFVFFIVGMAGASLLNERDTGTLRRLVAAPISRVAVIAGKALAYTLLACAQVLVLFGVGRIAFGMPLGRSPLALVVVTVLLGMVASAFGLMIAALARSAKQADNVGTMLGFLMAGLGGAIAIGPIPATRVEGIRSILARLTPQGNAVESYYSLMAEKGGLGDITTELLTLAGFLVLFVAVAAWRFRYEK
jgi:ABC-2 type transport system permease protein